jgi:hypothetical protein
MTIINLEIFLTFLVWIFWLGPFFISLKSGRVNVLHPQFITPFWISYFVLNTMVQTWSSWMGGTIFGILRTTNYEMFINRSYLITPLLIVILCAPFYHFGVRLFNSSIAKSSHEYQIFSDIKNVVPNKNKRFFSTILILVSAVIWLPNYFIPNADYGTFWTFPLAMTIVILPIMLFKIKPILGLISLIFVLFGASIMPSKAAFVFPLLPFVFYYMFTHFKIIRFKTWLVLFLSLMIVVLAFGAGGFNTDPKFKTNARKLLHRDYAFESFAALVNKSENRFFGNFEYFLTGQANGEIKSWTFNEFEKGIPSIIRPNKRFSLNPSHEVTEMYLPQDHKVLPDAYFNRFFVFSGYYDLGLIGAFLNAFLFGAFYGFIWKKVKLKVVEKKLLWPFFLYMPIPVVASYFIAVGGISYGLINSLIPIAIVYFILFLLRFTLTKPTLKIKNLPNES